MNDNNLLSALRAFIGAQDEQRTAKATWMELTSGDDNYFSARDTFRTADDRLEDLAAALLNAITECRASDQLEDTLESMSEDESRALRAFADNRGLLELLKANEPRGLGELVSKYRKAGVLLTAAQSLNRMRAAADDVAEWEAILDGEAPENITEGWTKTVAALTAEFDALAETTDADPADIWREVAYNVEHKARRTYDSFGEQLVDYIRNLVEQGRFDAEVAELPPELRRHARDLLRMVPQVQTQPETRPAPRTVEVLDRPETDVELSAEDQAIVDDLLSDLGLN